MIYSRGRKKRKHKDNIKRTIGGYSGGDIRLKMKKELNRLTVRHQAGEDLHNQ